MGRLPHFTTRNSSNKFLILDKLKIVAFIVSFCLSLFSCSREPKLPIGKEKLVRILADIHIAEGAMQSMTHVELADSLTNLYHGQIFEIHQVDQVSFDQTMAILREDPYLLMDLYTVVLDTIMARSTTLKK